MIKVREEKTPVDLTKAEAQALTDRIRDSIDKTYELVLSAYERKAWKVLGYKTWEAYVQTEFDMSRRRSYQLLDQGRVIRAIEDAVGGNVNHGTQIPERVARELKDDLPAAVEEIKDRAEKGEVPANAAKEIAAARIAEKERQRAERKAEQAKNEALRQENAAALPDDIKEMEARKQQAIAAKREKPAADDDELQDLRDRISELEENVAALEKENAALKAENKKFSEMKVEYEKGGFDEVIRGKDEVIRAQAARIESESQEKVRNLRRADYFLKILNEKYHHFKDVAIDLETGEVEYV